MGSEKGSSGVESDGVISVIIPTFRRPFLLRRAIASIQAQTYPKFRVCVYDDASGDETEQVVAEIAEADSRVQYYRHSANIGWLKGYGFAMDRVETEFFVLLGDDDLLLPDFFETALAGFEEHPEAMLSATATLHVDDRGLIFGAPILAWKPGFYAPPEGLRSIVRSGHPGWPSIVFRRGVLEVVRGLDERAGAATDVDFIMRVAGRFPMVVSTRPGSVMVRHSASVSSSLRLDLTWPCWLQLIQNLKAQVHLPEEIREYGEKVLHREIRRRLLVLNGFGSVVAGNWNDAHRSAEVLADYYGEKGRATLLHFVANVCHMFPPARLLAVLIASLRWRLHNLSLQLRYGTLIQPAYETLQKVTTEC